MYNPGEWKVQIEWHQRSGGGPLAVLQQGGWLPMVEGHTRATSGAS
jgi:hypothetical protein